MKKVSLDSHPRSIVKSVLWRLLGIPILAIITYIFTRSLIQTGLVTFLHHLTFIFIYYFHERLWLRINWSEKKKRGIKPVTYEIVLGHLVLGLITLLLTGSWLKVSLITITYIENKLWIYVVYDWMWFRIGNRLHEKAYLVKLKEVHHKREGR